MTAVPLFSLIVLFLFAFRSGSASTDAPAAELLDRQLVAYATFGEVGICHYLVNGGRENYFWRQAGTGFAGEELT
ncbi:MULTISPECIES: hypothetical protein [unclassified Mesorhizobium]|uniref:hypothetical protein n=1 Tax=unclassified Mesorhizobium TaxID=325217 RepID=UPI001128AA3D|nr:MULTISPECIES: hypothetical protein [unclassified Mesorhizobium]MBZ9955528.1 hypothetical protein [Mesorhizobium sp. BR1-1-15]TPN37575.1 hypothetical protein FJ979_15615 [Mesorhizobium sp. B1-1-6]